MRAALLVDVVTVGWYRCCVVCLVQVKCSYRNGSSGRILAISLQLGKYDSQVFVDGKPLRKNVKAWRFCVCKENGLQCSTRLEHGKAGLRGRVVLG
ncbi:hypothetical protein ONE63_003231 [Megalurothrips usitatus]|uniref:Secreted protein n=1 Tax=Megalurothrips usitatus TaxID=439358 RepID=A0AAV7X6P1_9NEOP|nr:hypothetical protein ONE63_003231 [Megalurothrips usitatus]